MTDTISDWPTTYCMQRHFAATSFLLWRSRCVQSYCGIFSMASMYIFFASELHNAKITVRNIFSTTVLSGWVLHGSLLHSGLEHGIFFNTDISQGSVATRFRYVGLVNDDFVANLLVNLSVKELWKSVNIWQRHGQDYSGLFFDSQCSFS